VNKELTLNWGSEISEREELVEGAEPRKGPTHLGLDLRRDLLRRRGLLSLAPTAAGLLAAVRGPGGCIFGCWRRRWRRRRRSGTEAGGAGDDVQEAPHMGDSLRLVVVLCETTKKENDRTS